MATLKTIANRDAKRVRDLRKQAPCTVYVQGSAVAKQIEERLSKDAEFMLMMKPQ